MGRYRILAVLIAAFGLPAAVKATAQTLPLQEGYYVANVPCAQASYGTISHYRGDTFDVGHFSCAVRVLSRTGETYSIERRCESSRDGTIRQQSTLRITSRTSFIEQTRNGALQNQYCAPRELPPPWGMRK